MTRTILPASSRTNSSLPEYDSLGELTSNVPSGWIIPVLTSPVEGWRTVIVGPTTVAWTMTMEKTLPLLRLPVEGWRELLVWPPAAISNTSVSWYSVGPPQARSSRTKKARISYVPPVVGTTGVDVGVGVSSRGGSGGCGVAVGA